jgi:hypothetical protein
MVLMSGWIAADCVDQDKLVPQASAAPRSAAVAV